MHTPGSESSFARRPELPLSSEFEKTCKPIEAAKLSLAVDEIQNQVLAAFPGAQFNQSKTSGEQTKGGEDFLTFDVPTEKPRRPDTVILDSMHPFPQRSSDPTRTSEDTRPGHVVRMSFSIPESRQEIRTKQTKDGVTWLKETKEGLQTATDKEEGAEPYLWKDESGWQQLSLEDAYEETVEAEVIPSINVSVKLRENGTFSVETDSTDVFGSNESPSRKRFEQIKTIIREAEKKLT